MIVYPEASTIQHCECLPTFHKVNSSDGNGFNCVCSPGHEFIEELGVCQQCGAGRFHPHFDLNPCTSCSSLLGPSSTTVTSMAIAPTECTCSSTFTKHQGRCVCADNRYGSSNGTFCDKCPDSLPFTLGPDAQTQDECLAASGSFEIENQRVASCNSSEFKDRVDCSAKGITLATLPLLNGYWRLSETSTQLLPCSPKTKCEPVKNVSKPGEVWWSDLYCTPGHTGIQCEDCKDGLIRSQGACVLCTSELTGQAWGLSALWIVFTTFVVLLPAWRVLYVALKKPAKEKHTKSKKPSKARSRFRICNQLYTTWKVRASLLIGFFQVYAQFVIITGLISGDDSGIVFLQVVTQFDLSALYMAFDTACAFPVHFLFMLFTYTLLPLLAILLMLVIYAFKPTAKVAGTVWYLTLLISFFVYPGVSSLVFQSFVWDDFFRSPHDTNPLRALAADLTILEDSEEATIAIVYSAIMVLVYPVGVVLLFYGAMRFHAKYEKSESQFKAEVAKSMAFMVESYNVPWYECYELVRKLVLTSGFLLVYTASKDGGILFYSILSTVFLYANRIINGYRSCVDFHFAEVSHVLIWAMGTLPIIDSIDKKAAQALAIAAPVVEFFLFLLSAYIPHTSDAAIESSTGPDTGMGTKGTAPEHSGNTFGSRDFQIEKASPAYYESRSDGDSENAHFSGGTAETLSQDLNESPCHRCGEREVQELIQH